MVNEQYSPLLAAVQYLAARCDGAITQDGVGFNSQDTKFGKRVAAMSVDEWTPEIALDVSVMLRTYRQQLAAGGIDYDSLPLVEGELDARTKYESRDAARQNAYQKKNAPYITIVGGEARVFNSYPIKDALKANGFRFSYDTKAWHSILSPTAAATILGIGSINLTDDQRMQLERLTDQADSMPADKPINIGVDDDGERLVMRTEYNQVPLDVVRAMPGRKWDGNKRVNYIDAHISVLKIADEFGLTVSDKARELIESNREANEAAMAAVRARVAESIATETTMEVAIADHLYPFQRAGAAYGIKHRRVLIGDEMGLGKTRQGLSIIESLDAYPVLIVVPPGLKLNWYKEITALLPHRSVGIYNGRIKGNVMMTEEIMIVGYPSIESHFDSLPMLGGLVLDECHYIKNDKAGRTKAILQLTGHAHDKYGQPIPGKVQTGAPMVFLTGTPILNRPIELVMPLLALGHLIQQKGAENSVSRFKYRYCDPQGTRGRMSFKGSSNENELNEWLRITCMVRRTKAQVLTELPPKIRAPQFTALDDSAMALYEKLGREGAERASQTRAEAIVYLNALRDAAGRAKIEESIRWIADFLDNGKQLVVFADHIRVQHAIIDALSEMGHDVAFILGGQSNKLTEDMKAKFQAGECKVIVCSFGAAREGHTLTAASDVLFVELGWNPGTHNQAEDRCHRIGQNDSVTAWWMIAQETIDEDTWDLIETKRRIIDAVTDGVMLTAVEESIFNELLDRTLSRFGASRNF